MPIFEVDHGGKIYEVDAPDIQSAVNAFAPRGASTSFGDTRQLGASVPTQNSFLKDLEKGLKTGAENLWRGIKTAGTDFGSLPDLPWESSAKTNAREPIRQQRLQEAQQLRAEQDLASDRQREIRQTPGGFIGNLGFDIASTLPLMAVPGANTYKGATLLGTVLGSLRPLGKDDSRTTNMALGGASSAIGQGIGNVVSGQGLIPGEIPKNIEARRLLELAKQNEIPITRFPTLSNVFQRLPTTAAAEDALVRKQNEAFTQGALRLGGSDAQLATPEVISKSVPGGGQGSAYENLSKVYEQLLGNKPINVRAVSPGGGGLLDTAASLGSRASEIQGVVKNSHLIDAMDRAVNLWEKGVIPGKVAQQGIRKSLTQEISDLGRETAEGKALLEIRSNLDSAMRAATGSPEAAAAWDAVNRQWANLSAITQAMNRGGQNIAQGFISPSALRAVSSKGASQELKDYARMGEMFVNRSPGSDTAQKTFWTNLLSTAGPAALLGGGTYGYTRDPEMAAYAAGTSLLLPKAAQMAINSGLLGGGLRLPPSATQQSTKALTSAIGINIPERERLKQILGVE